MPIIEVPGHGQVEFPDGMSDQDITDAIEIDILKTRRREETGAGILDDVQAIQDNLMGKLPIPVAGAMHAVGEVASLPFKTVGSLWDTVTPQEGNPDDPTASLGQTLDAGYEGAKSLMVQAGGGMIQSQGEDLMQTGGAMVRGGGDDHFIDLPAATPVDGRASDLEDVARMHDPDSPQGRAAQMKALSARRREDTADLMQRQGRNLIEAGAGRMELGAEAARFGRELHQEARELAPHNRATWGGNFKYLLHQAVESGLGSTLPALAVGAVTRSPNLGLYLMGTQVYGQKYGEQRHKGRTPDEAAMDATFYALSEVVTEKGPLEYMLRGGTSYIKKVVGGGIREGASEAINEAIQISYNAGMLDETMSMDEALKKIAESGVVGSIMGLGLSAATPGVVEPESDPRAAYREQQRELAAVRAARGEVLTADAADIEVEEALADLADMVGAPPPRPTDLPMTTSPGARGSAFESTPYADGTSPPAAVEYPGGIDATELQEPGIVQPAPLGRGVGSSLEQPSVPYDVDQRLGAQDPTTSPGAGPDQVGGPGVGVGGPGAPPPTSALDDAGLENDAQADRRVEWQERLAALKERRGEVKTPMVKTESGEVVEFPDPRIRRQDYREALEAEADRLVKGGGITYTTDVNGNIDGRTPSINPQWFQNSGYTVDYVGDTLSKALAGDSLGPRQSELIEGLIGLVAENRNTGTPTGDSVVGEAREELEAARAERRAVAQGFAPIGAYADEFNREYGEGDLYDKYPPEATADTRVMTDLARDAIAVDEDAAMAAMESPGSDADVAARLFDLIRNGQQAQETTDDTRGAETGSERDTGLPGSVEEQRGDDGGEADPASADGRDGAREDAAEPGADDTAEDPGSEGIGPDSTVEEIAASFDSRDKFESYMRGRLGKVAFKERRDTIMALWDQAHEGDEFSLTQPEEPVAETTPQAPDEDNVAQVKKGADEPGANNPTLIRRFASGSTRPQDLRGTIEAGNNPGVEVGELNATTTDLLSRSLNENPDVEVFVDSGAFRVFKLNEKMKDSGQLPIDGLGEGGLMLDFDDIMSRYEGLVESVDTPERLYLVMPDIVGDQAATLELTKQYADRIAGLHEAGASVIVPIQRGALPAAEAWSQTRDAIGVDDTLRIGIPSNAEAMTDEDFAGLVDSVGTYHFHILGGVTGKKLDSRMRVIWENAEDGQEVDVSADANMLRSRTDDLAGEGVRSDRVRDVLSSLPGYIGISKTDDSTTESEPESSAPDPDDMTEAEGGAVEAAASEAATSPENSTPEPTDAQKEAGNYKKGHLQLHGYDISIENPAGTKRRPEWPTLNNHYGYFKGTVGKDKDHVDVFIGPLAEAENPRIFVIDQMDASGTALDEHKVMFGFADEAAAREGYLENYEEGWNGLGAITEFAPDYFSEWLYDTEATKRFAHTHERTGTPERTIDPDTDTRGQADGAVETDDVREDSPGPLETAPSDDVPGDGARPDAGDASDSGGGADLPGTEGPGRVRDGVRGSDERGDQDAPPAAGRGDSAEPVAAGASDRVETPSTSDHTISDEDAIGEGGAKTKARRNVEAINLLKQIESEGREATASERKTLSQYVGWGGIPQIFEHPETGEVVSGWRKDGAALREALTEDEYADARRSTQDAHYTSPTVVKAIYTALEHFGVQAPARILEPAMGIGNFFGLMPTDLRARSGMVGIELDSITGRMAALLYPKADIHAGKGFQEVDIPDGYFDVAIGNPPFGSQKVFDARRRAISKFSIHNYFFAKSIDSLREGGILAMVVSNNLMDKAGDKQRAYFASKANLLGAVRLPNTAFKANAGTEVTTDILFLQKRAETEAEAESWSGTIDLVDPDGGENIPVNEYYGRHPENLLGQMTRRGTMYGANQPALVEVENYDWEDALTKAVRRMQADVYSVVKHEDQIQAAKDDAIPEDTKVYGFFMRDGEVWQRLPDHLGHRQSEKRDDLGKTPKARVMDSLKVLDALNTVMGMEMSSEADGAELDAARHALNTEYDSFVKKHGYFNQEGNKRALSQDPANYPRLMSLERDFKRGVTPARAKKLGIAPEPPSATKADIFTQRVIVPHRQVLKADNPEDALAISLNEFGTVDIEHMAGLLGMEESAVASALAGRVYNDPKAGWVSDEEYLSGNVKLKLAEAREAAKLDPDFNANVSALEKAQPEDVEPIDIWVPITSPWIPPSTIAQFADHLLGATVDAKYVPTLGRWEVSIDNVDTAKATKWKTDRVAARTLLEKVIQGASVEVKDRTVDGKSVTNKDASLEAAQKADEIKEEWQDWVWEDTERRTLLARIYNDTFNTDREAVYNGSHLTFPGKVPDNIVQLRDHQVNAIWRGIRDGRALYDHVVGAGKTFTIIGTIMEGRRMGLMHKPMVVVPNHLVEQWASDFYALYPGAKVLTTTKKDFEKKNRRALMARIATGDWDAVIVGHSSFGKIPVPTEEMNAFLKEQIADIEAAMDALEGESGAKRTIKQLEKRRDKIKERIERALDQRTKDDVVNFAETGVDNLFIDEAHKFKNLAYTTQMQNVGGLGSQSGSQKATDLFVKGRMLQKRNSGRGMFFATGTPVSNSLVELFTMQRYLDYDNLKARGLASFDSWANVFADARTGWEIDATGNRYKLKTRFARFVNMPELMASYRSFADMVSLDHLKTRFQEQGKRWPVPNMKGGKPENIVVDRSFEQGVYMAEIVKRADNLDPSDLKSDNMLKITSDARRAGLDIRLVWPDAPDSPDSKINKAVERTKALYDRWQDDRGTQMIFIDMVKPQAAAARDRKKVEQLLKDAESENDEVRDAAIEKLGAMSVDDIESNRVQFDVYADMRGKLIASGIDPSEIAYIHDANTDKQKAELFESVNAGLIRVLMGSTEKMGAGTNAQERLVGLHHIDVPWRPSDLEQREGRIIRQGNKLYERDPEGFEVEVNRYATNQTYDARMWQTIETKAGFVEQLRNWTGGREIEDIEGQAAAAAEMKAAASGNPLILEQVELDQDVKKLTTLEKAHKRKRYDLENTIARLESFEARYDERVADAEKMIRQRDENTPDDGFVLDGKTYEKRADVGKVLTMALTKKIKARGVEAADTETAIGVYRGFSFYMINVPLTRKETALSIYVRDHKGDDLVGTYAPSDKPSGSGLLTRMDNWLARLDQEIDNIEEGRQRAKRELKGAQDNVGAEFKQAEELATKRARLAEVIKILQNPDAQAETAAVTGGFDPEAAFAPFDATRLENPVMFSREAPADHISVQPGPGRPTRMTVDGVRAAIRDVVSTWGETAPDVVVVDGYAELPSEARPSEESLVPGVYHDGTLFLVAGQMRNTDHVLRVLAHEAVGHHAMIDMLGADFLPLVDRVVRLADSDKAARSLADEVRSRYGQDVDREQLGGEMLAVLAERRQAEGRLGVILRRVRELIRAFLVRLGITSNFTATDIDILMSKAGQRLRRGTRGGVGAGPTRPMQARMQSFIDVALQMARDPSAFQNPTSESKSFGGVLKDMGIAGDYKIVLETDQDLQVEYRDGVEVSDGLVVGNIALSVAGIDTGSPNITWIGDSDLRAMSTQGGTARGSALYQAVMTWAHNNNLKLLPDDTLEPVNWLRRSEALISSMLRHGTSRHLQIHHDQLIGLFGDGEYEAFTMKLPPDATEAQREVLFEAYHQVDDLKFEVAKTLWRNEPKTGDRDAFRYNLANTMLASAALAYRRVPALRDFYVDPKGNVSRRVDGRWVKSSFDELPTDISPDVGVGRTTAERAVRVVSSLLGDRPSGMASPLQLIRAALPKNVGGQGAQPLTGEWDFATARGALPVARRTFYSREGTPRYDNGIDASELSASWTGNDVGPVDESPGGPDAPTPDFNYTEAQERFLAKIGRSSEGETLRQKLIALFTRAKLRLHQGLVDQHSALMGISEKAWKLARMSHASSGAVEALFNHGRVFMDKDGAIDVDTNGEGFMQVVKPVGEEIDRFLGWIAANRAAALKAEGREHLFEDDEIQAAIRLNEGKMADGRSRRLVYAEAHRGLKSFQSAVLDVAERAGVINAESRQTWEGDFYVPFYRLAEDESHQGPQVGGGLVNQKGIRRLKGRNLQLNDLLANTIMNWEHLVSASMKNIAAQEALDAAETMEVAEQIPEKDRTPQSVYYLKDGQKQWFEVEDKILLNAITSLHWNGLSGGTMRAARWFKRTLTWGVTANPEFRVANLIRDSIHAVATSPLNYNVLANVKQGWTATRADSLTKARMLAGGGEMHFGHLYAGDPESARLVLDRRLDAESGREARKMKRAYNKAKDFWDEWGSRFENVNRAAIYEQMIADGASHFDASFEARDLADFSQGGGWVAIRALTATVPFLNARIQGLDKGYRAMRSPAQRAQFFLVTGVVMAASILYYLAMRDDDDWQKFEDWERDAYWIFKIPGTDNWFRLPKPFEVGAIGTIAERTAEAIYDGLEGVPGAGERFMKRLAHVLMETLSFNPTPQIVRPALEAGMNKDWFTGREIEPGWMRRQNLSPELRKREHTSPSAVAVGEALSFLPDAIQPSPLQIEHLIEGYLAWVGTLGVGAADAAWRNLDPDAPPSPTSRVEDYEVVGRFIRRQPLRNTRYQTMFWEIMDEVSQARADVMQLRRDGDMQGALEKQTENRDVLRHRKFMESQRRRLKMLSQRMKRIRESQTMPPDDKRQRLDELNARKNAIQQRAVERVKSVRP